MKQFLNFPSSGFIARNPSALDARNINLQFRSFIRVQQRLDSIATGNVKQVAPLSLVQTRGMMELRAMTGL